MKKRIAILGSTGSIGTQALEIIESHSDSLEVEVLTANKNADLLIEQAIKFKPNCVVIADKDKRQFVSAALSKYDIKVYSGAESINQVVSMNTIDLVLVALVGWAGVEPTIRAIEAKKDIALANKEALVVAGSIITKLVKENQVSLLPVDSEHSAIFQCIIGEYGNKIKKIILTASGGPFRGKKYDFLKDVTPQQALKHPNWVMGNKVTIDSATLMNKGLEVIEAKWLFDVNADRIEVLVHPQSIIHSMVQFADGSIKAQLGTADMRLPIQYSFTFPERKDSVYPHFNFVDNIQFTFETPDRVSFPCLDLAYEVLRKGGNMPCVLNAADEIAVDAFLKNKIKFTDIPIIIEKTLNKCSFIQNPNLDDYVLSNDEAKEISLSLL